MNYISIVISVMSVIFLFLAVLICVGMVYVLYKFNKLEEQLSEGFHINIVQDGIGGRVYDE